ncbi:HTH-type transcriptional activator IlvY [Bacterioplanoides pacificum]|uniref:HTH-type transcriptional activator IlvY n=1 Tax=Bacterioplanoides pacificum TaxID=1171596 RepID=A0ABV7VWX9_9GAMM
MDYKDLQSFLSLCSHLHLGKASEELHMSPSTLSRRLARMEEEVGATLLIRETSPLSLTHAGEQFRRHAENTLSDWQQLKRAVGVEVSDLEGSLTLFCTVTASYSFLADLLTRFRERYPRVELLVHTGDAAESIPKAESGEADIVVAARPEQLSEDLSFKTITPSPLLFIAPKNLSSLPLLTQAEIDWGEVPMVLSESGLARTRVDRWFAARNIRPNIYAQVSGHEAIVSMVALGAGVGVVPELVLKNSPMSARVRVLAVQPELEPFAVGLCARTERLQHPLLQAIWNVSAAMDNTNTLTAVL